MIRQTAQKASRITSNAFAFSRRSSSHASNIPGGAGYTGNIYHQMVPVDEEENLFRHVKSPNTISVIG